jgi:hypothetical protein
MRLKVFVTTSKSRGGQGYPTVRRTNCSDVGSQTGPGAPASADHQFELRFLSARRSFAPSPISPRLDCVRNLGIIPLR